MNKFLLILINDQGGPDSSRLNELIHGLQHPALDRVFECIIGSPYPCPYPIEQVKSVPVLKFMLKRPGDAYQEVDEMYHGISRDNVVKKLDSLAVQNFPEAPGQGGDGIIPGGKPGGDLMGLGLFNLGGSVPGWLWLLIAGVSLYKAYSSKTPAGRYGWGAMGTLAGLNWWNKRSN